MISFLSIIAIGFFLGMRHATDPDHVIAVTTIVSKQNKIGRAALTGIFWGIGHTLTILAVGSAIILFGLVIPARIGLSMEFSVALMLVVLGAMNIVAFVRSSRSVAKIQSVAATVHSHPHSHGDYIHSHPHSHAPESHPHSPEKTPVAKLDKMLRRFRTYSLIRPLIIGVVHGLSGSAAVALLVVPIIRDPKWSIAYLLVFGVGTIVGMMLITMTIASAFHLVRGGQKFFQRLAFASGLLSLCFGLFIAYQICIVNGLFSTHPMWTPK